MRKLYSTLLILFIFCFAAQAQWTVTGGPYGGQIDNIKISPSGALYAIVNQRLFTSTAASNGDVWTQVSATLYVSDIIFDTDGAMYALNYSTMYKSIDNGATWKFLSSTTINTYEIRKVGPAGVFVASGSNGVAVSTNKGTTWTVLASAQGIYRDGLATNAAGDIYYATSSGKILKHLYGDGASWSAANVTNTGFNPSNAAINIIAIAATGAGAVFATTSSDVFTSTNAGTTFSSIKAGLAPETDFYGKLALSPDAATVYYVTYGSAIYKLTTPASPQLPASWTKTSAQLTSGLSVQRVLFTSATSFFIGSDDGMFRSTDSGASLQFKGIGIPSNIGDIEVSNSTPNRIIATTNGSSYWTSTDGGASWTRTSTSNYLTGIIKLVNGTNNGALIIYGYNSIVSTDNGATFVAGTDYNSYSKMVEAANGDVYAFGYGKVYKSINKGLTFTALTIANYPTTFTGYVAAIDGTTNMMVNGYDQATSTYKTFKIVGSTATLVTTPYQYNYNNIFFQNSKFYLAQNSAIYSTTDLGTNFTTIGFSGDKAIPLKNSTYSGIAVSKSGSLYISQDNGGSWNNANLPVAGSYIQDIATDASGTFFAATYGSPVLKNSSQLLVDPATLPPFINFNWTPLNGPYGGKVTKLETHPDGSTLFSVSANKLWKYSGTSWAVITPNAAEPFSTLNDVEVDAAGNVYAMTLDDYPHKIFRSIDKGVTWTQVTANGIGAQTDYFKLEILSDGSVVLLGNDELGYSVIYNAPSIGTTATFTKRFTGAYLSFYTSIAINPKTGTIATFGLNTEGLLVSTNKGTNWTVKSMSSIMDPAKGNVGSYMYDTNGNLLIQTIVDASIKDWTVNIAKSANDGTSWSILSVPSPRAPDNTFSYSKRIVTLGTGEYLLTIQTRFDGYRSTDGGATWTLLGNVGDTFTNTVTRGTTSYILGNGDAGILKTTDGGLTYAPFSNGIPHPNANAINLSSSKEIVIGATRPYYTSDLGQTFTLASLQPAANFLQVKDSLIGYGSRLLLKSKDAGKTWTAFGTDQFLTFLTADATGNGYYGSDGTKLNYSTDLINWTNITLTGLPTAYVINSMVINSGGIIFAVVTDNTIPATPVKDVYKIVFGSAVKISSVIGTTKPGNILYVNGKIYVYDTNGSIYKSADGDAWTQASAPSGTNLVVSNNYLFIPGGGTVLWLSRNDGGSWQSVGDAPAAGGVFKNVVVNEYDGYAYATLTNSVARKSGNMVIPDDKTKPVVAVFSPLNNATGVAAQPVLKITFDEVTKSVAGKLVRIFDATAPTVPVATLDMATATQSAKTWSIATTTPLSYNKTYFVVVDPGAVADIFGNQFAGISSATTWKFTTSSPPDTQAPVITFTADAIQKGSGNKVFSVTITDNISVATAKISYRSITTNNAVTTTNLTLNGTTGKYEVTIPESSFGPMGLEYFFTASDAAPNTTRSPLTGNYYSYITYPTATNPTVTGALVGVGGKVADWRIITIPFALADNRVSTVFSELGTVDNSKWRFINYKTAAAWNEYPADFSTFTQGKGYFINMTSPTALVVEGATTPSWNKETPFVFTLVPGWNQIGNPYTYPMKWSEVLAANSNPASIATTMKGYKGSYADAAQLEVFEGAFVLNSGTSNVTMTAPIVGSLAGGRTSAPSYDLSAGDWLVPITLKSGAIENTFGGVGMNSKASVGVDAYDDFNPPSLFDFAQINFPHPEHFLKQSTRDVVPVMDEFKWEFTVATNQAGTSQLKWDNSILGNGSKDLFLLDVALQTITNMRETNSYSFKNSESNGFRVFFGSDLKDSVKPERISLGNAYPNPTSGKSVIPFTLPASNGMFQVRIEMYNMMGQKVGTLIQGDFAPGFYKTEWDGSDESLTTGLYTYRLLVSDPVKTEVLNGKIVLKK